MAIRESTIPIVLSKDQLYQMVLGSIEDAGWIVNIVSRNHGLKIKISNGEVEEEIIIYIWNISHGGKTRSKYEYRIQIKGHSLDVSYTYKTLLLGWYYEGILVGFDASKHAIFGASPSVQVNKATLERAKEEGIAFETKKIRQGETVIVAFRPSYIMDYIENLYPQYHRLGRGRIAPNEIKTLTQMVAGITLAPSVLNFLPEKRREAVVTLKKKLRDARFQKGIFALYGGRCAICGLQARLTEAAHIIAVKDDGMDELINGVLLCRNHHKAYDSGLLGIDEDFKIKQNDAFVKHLTNSSQDNKLTEFLASSRIGEKITLPSDANFYPKKEYLRENCRLKHL